MSHAHRTCGSELPHGFVSGNYYDKFRSTIPLYARLVDGFVRAATSMMHLARPSRILEVGCGPGDFGARLLKSVWPDRVDFPSYTGTDISGREIETARLRYPSLQFQQASAYELPFAEASFDLVLACEVFEHLERPTLALGEIKRVCDSYLLLSVPWEPVWRVANVLRGKYLREMGNTPGHVQHFSRDAIRRLVRTGFHVIAEERPFPWTMLLAKRASLNSGPHVHAS